MTSVIVLVINGVSILADKLERYPPVTANGHGPRAFAVTREPVKTQPWKGHVLWRRGRAQAAQDQAQPFGLLWLDTGLRAGLEEFGQPLVPEAADHSDQCNLKRYGSQDRPTTIGLQRRHLRWDAGIQQWMRASVPRWRPGMCETILSARPRVSTVGCGLVDDATVQAERDNAIVSHCHSLEDRPCRPSEAMAVRAS